MNFCLELGVRLGMFITASLCVHNLDKPISGGTWRTRALRRAVSRVTYFYLGWLMFETHQWQTDIKKTSDLTQRPLCERGRVRVKPVVNNGRGGGVGGVGGVLCIFFSLGEFQLINLDFSPCVFCLWLHILNACLKEAKVDSVLPYAVNNRSWVEALADHFCLLLFFLCSLLF